MEPGGKEACFYSKLFLQLPLSDNYFPTSPASCNAARDSPLGMAIESAFVFRGGRQITVLEWIFFRAGAVLRRLDAGGWTVALEATEGRGKRDACTCHGKQL